MSDNLLGVIEARFADMIWREQPVKSAQLVKLAAEEFEWKKSTTYTVLKRLCDKGIFKNEDGTVRALVSRDEFYAARSEQFVDEAFNGSLPAFLTAFASRKKLSEKEIEQLQRLIDSSRG